MLNGRTKKENKNKLFNAAAVNHQAVIEKLVQESSPRKTFLTMIFVSSIMAALGLLNDSASVVIGAMLVAPLLWPVLGVAMGILMKDFGMLALSFVSIILSTVIAIVTAMFITFNYIPLGAVNDILNSQTDFDFMIPVAIAAGLAAALALSFESIKEAVSGIAISVALIPPVVAIGIGLGGTDWSLMQQAARLFMINLLGIIGTSFIVFYLLGFYKYSKTLKDAVKKEEKVLKTAN